MSSSVIAKLDKYDGDVSTTAKGKRDVVFFSRRKNHELTWRYKLVKYALIAMTALVLIFGLAVLVSTAYMSTTSLFKLAGMSVAIGLAVIGALIVVMALLGVCGSVGENRFLLLAYCGIMGLMLFIQFIITGWVFAQRGQLQALLSTGWKSASNDDRVTIQNTWNCCGFQNFNATNEIGDPCPTAATVGCYGAVKTQINNDWNWLSGAAIIICLFEFVSIALSMVLSKGIKKAIAANKVNKAIR
eukprot:TRINITY_DN78945_c0_g1_i1.p1 TRINITY_DN78945_c0_g1~~TRINITY_DN78945_c0_g1_i1.p1  ORF type:complete len:254 (+),score=66.49 TRINITY_DN78945_c0_g1_i1:31-762(+)